MVARLYHNGQIYKNDNTLVYIKTKKVARGTSVESIFKAFSCFKGGRGALLFLFWIMQVIPSIVQSSKSVWAYSRILSKMDDLTPFRIMSLIIIKQLKIFKNVLLILLILSQIKLSGLNIWLIAFNSQIMPFNMKLIWHAWIKKYAPQFWSINKYVNWSWPLKEFSETPIWNWKSGQCICCWLQLR